MKNFFETVRAASELFNLSVASRSGAGKQGALSRLMKNFDATARPSV
jgi:hypothetical protein